METCSTRGSLQLEEARAFGQAIYAHVGGHPYLTQRLGGWLEEYRAAGESLTPAYLDRAVEQILRDDPLLRHVRKALDEQRLSAAARSLLNDRLRFSRLDEEMARLELVGLAKELGGYWTVRNRLLGCALREWVDVLPDSKKRPSL